MYVEKEARSINKINDDIKSAGQSFLGLHMADLLTRIKELDDKVSKSKLIEEYHSNQQGYYDKDTGGTRTRVNAAIRIIKAEKVMYALEQIDGSDPRVLPEAANKAINKGYRYICRILVVYRAICLKDGRLVFF
jgi:hypothetical protein